jgi:hypothetical protein
MIPSVPSHILSTFRHSFNHPPHTLFGPPSPPHLPASEKERTAAFRCCSSFSSFSFWKASTCVRTSCEGNIVVVSSVDRGHSVCACVCGRTEVRNKSEQPIKSSVEASSAASLSKRPLPLRAQQTPTSHPQTPGHTTRLAFPGLGVGIRDSRQGTRQVRLAC